MGAQLPAHLNGVSCVLLFLAFNSGSGGGHNL